MKKDNIFLKVCIVLVIIIIGSLFITKNRTKPNIVDRDTIYTTQRDTLWKDTVITEKEFIPKYITITKIDTLFNENGDSIQLIRESKCFDKTLVSDKDTANLEIYTSGIETSLDSLKMRLKTHNEVITNTVEVIKYIEKPKKFLDRFHIQPQITSGYDLFNKQWGLMVGIGLGIDL